MRNGKLLRFHNHLRASFSIPLYFQKVIDENVKKVCLACPFYGCTPHGEARQRRGVRAKFPWEDVSSGKATVEVELIVVHQASNQTDELLITAEQINWNQIRRRAINLGCQQKNSLEAASDFEAFPSS